MRRRFLMALAAAALAVSSQMPAAHAESQLDFTLVNSTGYGISELYIAPSASDDWEDNMLEKPFENGQSLTIHFSPKAEAVKEWDLMVKWIDDDDSVYWRKLKLANIHKITLKYNRDSQETSAAIE